MVPAFSPMVSPLMKSLELAANTASLLLEVVTVTTKA